MYFFRPSAEVVRLLLSRGNSSLNSKTANSSTADDLLSVTALHYWGCPGRQNAQRFAEILGTRVTKWVTGLRQANDSEDGGSSSTKKRNGLK